MPFFTTEQKIHLTLRSAVAMCFMGHGAFGIITKPIWTNYFAIFGIGKALAYQLMPLLGTFDIALGIIMLVYPLRVIPMWLVCWGIVTALLRPLSGESYAEFIERAGNFGAPLALLLFSGEINFKNLFAPLRAGTFNVTENIQRTTNCLKIISFLLLAGHGVLNLIGKPGLIDQYHLLGFTNAGKTAQFIGALEITAAIAILVKPSRSLIMVLLIWKIISELFYPHYEVFEWVERGGSYGCLLALWFILNLDNKSNPVANGRLPSPPQTALQ